MSELGFCGDGILQIAIGEECDEGAENGQPVSDCDFRCKYSKLPDCGDGVVNPLSEQCDEGADNGNYPGAGCRENCRLPYCGDGVRDRSEECDDGNNLDNDGCTSECKLERRAAPPYVSVNTVTDNGQYPSLQIASSGGGRTEGKLPANIPSPARTQTGPGIIIFLASGAAAGIGLVRRRIRGVA